MEQRRDLSMFLAKNVVIPSSVRVNFSTACLQHHHRHYHAFSPCSKAKPITKSQRNAYMLSKFSLVNKN